MAPETWNTKAGRVKRRTIILSICITNVILGGVSLVAVFSLGLTVVLIAIGIVLVKAAHIAGRYLGDKVDGDGTFTRYTGAVSAIVVTIMGVAMTIRAKRSLIRFLAA